MCTVYALRSSYIVYSRLISTVYHCTRCRLAEPREAPTLEEAHAIIDRLASGVSFFTKELIQDMWDQIKREPARGDKILTKDITGAVVECDVETGKVGQWSVDDTEICVVSTCHP